MEGGGADAVGAHARIDFSLEKPPEDPSDLEKERAKHRDRAERFGASYRDPGRRKEFQLESKKERLAGEGFVTGIDVFSEEEKAKRAARAAKFGLQQSDTLVYAPDPEEQKKAERGAKFGTGYHADAALMDMDLFEERADAPVDAPRRPDAIYLYGVDVMSTADIKSYFADYAPKFVEWINDSSCCVLFGDAASAARAIIGTGHPMPPDQEAPDAGGQAGLDPTSVESLPYLWHKGKDFVKGGTTVSLMYRLATEADKKDTSAPRRSRFLWKTSGSSPSQRGGRSRGRGRGGGGGDSRKRGEDGEYGGRNGGMPGGSGAGGDGMDGLEEYGAAHNADGTTLEGAVGDVEMRRGRGERGGEQRRRRKRAKQLDGSYRDVDMVDAGRDREGSAGPNAKGGSPSPGPRRQGRGGKGHGGGGSGSGSRGRRSVTPSDKVDASAVTAERFGVPDLRELLQQRKGAGGGGGSGSGAAGGRRGRGGRSRGGRGYDEHEPIHKLDADAFEEVADDFDDG